ncbi:single-stranded DNA-binding protein [Gordonia sp. CPCC 206044]|uniref:single-stranded DNA-binding protein n=1 Tax=Gordonia sp. CPCC 206044 TaxID=3140793 RepID=UPI003AF3BBD8
MLPSISHVFRLTADPKVTELAPSDRNPNGGHVLALRLAANASRWDQQSGRWVNTGSLFVDAELFGSNAPVIAAAVGKGSMVAVSGELVTDQWTGRDGSPKSRIKIKARTVHPIAAPSDRSHPAPSGPPDAYDDEPPF